MDSNDNEVSLANEKLIADATQHVIEKYLPPNQDEIFLIFLRGLGKVVLSNISTYNAPPDAQTIFSLRNSLEKYGEEFDVKHPEFNSEPYQDQAKTFFHALVHHVLTTLISDTNKRAAISKQILEAVVDARDIDATGEIAEATQWDVEYHKRKLEQYSQQNSISEAAPLGKISDLWKHNPQQLRKLSNLLAENGFTGRGEDFSNAYSENLAEPYKFLAKPCAWKKSKTSFLYLIKLVHTVELVLPDALISFIIERFRFKGKKNVSNRDIIRNQFREVVNKYSAAKDDQLPLQLASIRQIYSSVFSKK